MKEKRDYKIYLHALNSSWKLVTKKPVVLLPDLLFLLSILLFVWSFLLLNGLFSPLLQANRLIAFETAFKNLFSSAPALLKLGLTSLILLFLHLITGITFINTRYLLIKAHLKQEPLSFFKAFKESSAYFWKTFFIRLFLFCCYGLPTLIFFFVLIWKRTMYQQLLPYGITFLAVSWFIVQCLFFFTYPVLFLKEKNFKAVFHSVTYAKKELSHTFFTIAVVTTFSFFVTLFLSLFPHLWASIALSTGLLAYSSIFFICYFIFSKLLDVFSVVFESVFIFECYHRKN